MDRTVSVLGSGSAAGFWPGRFRLGGVGVGPGVVFAPADEGAGGGGEAAPAAGASAGEGTAAQAEGGTEKPVEAKPPGSLLTDAAEEKGGQAAGEEGEEGEAAKEPIVYDDFTAPEGLELSGPTLDAFKALAAEHGLSQDAAQSFMDLHVQTVTGQADARAALVQGWADDARGDREFGGATFDANMGIAGKALQAYGSPQLAQFLTQSGFGNHPEVIRAFYRIGKTLGEDGKAPSASSAAAKDPMAAMYPTMFPNT